MDFSFLLIALILVPATVGIAMFANTPNPERIGRQRLVKMRSRVAPSGEDVLAAQMRRTIAARLPSKDASIVRLIPNPERIALRLRRTGKSWTLSNYVLMSAGLTVVAIGIFALQGVPFLLTLFLALLVGVGLPHMYIGRLIKKRQRQFIERFPDATDLLVRGLRSGLPISETLGAVALEIPGPVGVEFKQVIERVRIGKTMEQALQETADVIDLPEFQFFVITLAIQRETGGNLAETLGNLSEVLRKRAQMKLKVKALSSEAKASAWIVGCLPFAVFILMYLSSPEYVSAFLPWTAQYDQRVMLAGLGGLVWMSIGVFMMSKMISFEI